MSAMCGIVGILGREPVAEQLVDALKRLEYRGYDSAGVATLEAGRLTRRRAEGKLRNLETKLRARAAHGQDRHRPHPLGDPRQAERDQCPSACHRPAGGRAQRHHRELPRAARGARAQGREIRHRDRHRGGRPSGDRGDEEGPLAGRGGGGGAAAAARRVRARLPVRGRERSPDRRAQGLAARGRLRRGRDVSRLRRHRARAVHRHHLLSRGRRHGGAHPQGRRGPRRQGLERRAGGGEILGLRVPGRQGQPPPLHGEGDPRAARGRRPYAGALSRHGGRAGGAAGGAAVRLPRARAHLDLGLRHRLLRRAGRQILVRALRAPAGRDRCRVRVPLPRGPAQGRAAWRSSSRNRARPPTRWRRCATPRSTSSTCSRWSTCRPRPSRARATW